MDKEVIRPFTDKDENLIGYHFWCPGCKDYHGVWTNHRNPLTNANWSFNGDMVKPTFSPSILVAYPANPKASNEFKEWGDKRRCHSFVRNGQIQFLNDCTHELAGKTVELKPFE